MIQLRLLLSAIYESLRFIKRYRERQAEAHARLAEERRLERDHQKLMLLALGQQLVDVIKSNQEGLLEIAKASAAQAEAFGVWLKSFQTTPDPEPSRTIRDEDEWEMEQERLAESDPELVMHSLPPEFQVAFALNKLDASRDPNPDFDREGRDIV